MKRFATCATLAFVLAGAACARRVEVPQGARSLETL